MANPTFKITMENGGVIEGELYPDKAPQSVANFVDLANHNYYDGLIFHRVIPGFMIQGGCPEGTGMGGPGYCIKGEFFFNGIKNDLKHKRGVLSMARSQSPNSAGSQFFIMHQDAKHLDGQYAAFGKVTSGMDVVDAIAKTRTGMQDRPIEEQKYLANLEMKSSDLDLREEAFSTKSRIFDTVDSPKALVVRIFRTPVKLMQPLITSSPTEVPRGRLSPVNAAVSREEEPSSTVPSMGIFSPGWTTIRVPMATSSGSSCSSLPSISTLA